MIWEVAKGSVTRVPNKTERSKQLNIHATLLKKTTTTETPDSMTNFLFSIILSVPPPPPSRKDCLCPLPFVFCAMVTMLLQWNSISYWG